MTAGRALRIASHHLARIGEEARFALPRECCGLLLGRETIDGWQVTELVTSPNVAPADRHDRFEIDPQILIAVQKRLRREGGAMIGVYHSHPNGRATPSDTDLAQAWQIGKIWVIAALSADTPLSLGAFLRTDTAFAPVPMIAEGTG